MIRRKSAALQGEFSFEFHKFTFLPWPRILSAIHLHLIPSRRSARHSPSCHAVVVLSEAHWPDKQPGKKENPPQQFMDPQTLRAFHRQRSIKMSHVDYVPGCQDDGMAVLFNPTSNGFSTSIPGNHHVCTFWLWGSSDRMLYRVVIGWLMNLHHKNLLMPEPDYKKSGADWCSSSRKANITEGWWSYYKPSLLESAQLL